MNTLKAIFDKHVHERICVLGTLCAGKTTLVNLLSDYHCLDMDDILWPNIPQEDMELFNTLIKKPWSEELGREVDRLTYKYLKATPGQPLFTSVIVECEAVVYLDIADNLLMQHCKKRNYSFGESKDVKAAIEKDWDDHRIKNDKTFYYVTITE